MWVVRGEGSEMERGIREVIFSGFIDLEYIYKNFRVECFFEKFLFIIININGDFF